MKRPVVAVLRIFGPAAAGLESDPLRLRADVRARWAGVREAMLKAGLAPTALQLDLDCPERLLSDYARFLRDLRADLPGVTLTVTALPCHLDRRAFAEVADACDGFTLQVHGLDFPRFRGEHAPLLNRAGAEEALRRADRLGRPFDVALPTYAQELVFERATGRFVGLLQPADPPPHPERFVTDVSAPAAADVQQLLVEASRMRHCRGVHWFRLPVPGDRQAWDLATLRRVRDGRPLAAHVGAEIRAGDDGRWFLVVSNRALLAPRYATVDLRWPFRQGDYALRGARADPVTGPGWLPERLIVQVPGPGVTQTAGWFRVGARPSAVVLQLGVEPPRARP